MSDTSFFIVAIQDDETANLPSSCAFLAAAAASAFTLAATKGHTV